MAETGLPTQDQAPMNMGVLIREIGHLTTLMETRAAGDKAITETRLIAMDKAVVLFEANLTRVPTEVQKAITHLQSLHETLINANKDITAEKFAGLYALFLEKFGGIATQLGLRDTALTTALQAAEKAVANQQSANALANEKMEKGFEKQIGDLGALLRTLAASLNEKIDDGQSKLVAAETRITSSISTLESRITGTEGRSRGLGDGWGYLVGGIGVVIAVVTAYAHFSNQTTPIGIDSKRVDDLQSRLDSLVNRLTPPVIPAKP